MQEAGQENCPWTNRVAFLNLYSRLKAVQPLNEGVSLAGRVMVFFFPVCVVHRRLSKGEEEFLALTGPQVLIWI